MGQICMTNAGTKQTHPFCIACRRTANLSNTGSRKPDINAMASVCLGRSPTQPTQSGITAEYSAKILHQSVVKMSSDIMLILLFRRNYIHTYMHTYIVTYIHGCLGGRMGNVAD